MKNIVSSWAHALNAKTHKWNLLLFNRLTERKIISIRLYDFIFHLRIRYCTVSLFNGCTSIIDLNNDFYVWCFPICVIEIIKSLFLKFHYGSNFCSFTILYYVMAILYETVCHIHKYKSWGAIKVELFLKKRVQNTPI